MSICGSSSRSCCCCGCSSYAACARIWRTFCCTRSSRGVIEGESGVESASKRYCCWLLGLLHHWLACRAALAAPAFPFAPDTLADDDAAAATRTRIRTCTCRPSAGGRRFNGDDDDDDDQDVDDGVDDACAPLPPSSSELLALLPPSPLLSSTHLSQHESGTPAALIESLTSLTAHRLFIHCSFTCESR